MALDDNTRRLLQLVFCYDYRRIAEVTASNRLLAHYTTAETAMKIIKGRTLWLRNAAVMNDYSEIAYGRDVTRPVFESPAAARLFDLLNTLRPKLSDDLMLRHAGHRNHARETVFMSSLSEHDPEDTLGRLSMWRAYGGPVAGVALLFNNSVLTTELDFDLNVDASPVLYGGTPEFAIEFEEMVLRIEREKDFLADLPPDLILDALSGVLQLSMLSIKHPGFREEQEWRLVHRPFEFSSARVIPTTYTLGGIPQAVYELPFHDPGKGELFNMPQLDLNSILAGIILGPCLYPETLMRAFHEELRAAGVQNPVIHVSHIPLRQQW